MGWLSVDDYLPGDTDNVIIYFTNNSGEGVTTAYFFDDGFYMYIDRWLGVVGVTHWQSLPGPPLTLI